MNCFSSSESNQLLSVSDPSASGLSASHPFVSGILGLFILQVVFLYLPVLF